MGTKIHGLPNVSKFLHWLKAKEGVVLTESEEAIGYIEIADYISDGAAARRAYIKKELKAAEPMFKEIFKRYKGAELQDMLLNFRVHPDEQYYLPRLRIKGKARFSRLLDSFYWQDSPRKKEQKQKYHGYGQSNYDPSLSEKFNHTLISQEEPEFLIEEYSGKLFKFEAKVKAR